MSATSISIEIILLHNVPKGCIAILWYRPPALNDVLPILLVVYGELNTNGSNKFLRDAIFTVDNPLTPPDPTVSI